MLQRDSDGICRRWVSLQKLEQEERADAAAIMIKNKTVEERDHPRAVGCKQYRLVVEKTNSEWIHELAREIIEEAEVSPEAAKKFHLPVATALANSGSGMEVHRLVRDICCRRWVARVQCPLVATRRV